MSEFILPIGTVLKYGTISTQLYPILRHGIHAATTPRVSIEAGPVKGTSKAIYVGELMAYFDTCAAFCNATSQLHAANEEVLGRFVQALQEAHGQKPEMPELETIAAQAGIPIVIDIELGEPCVLWADENFIDDSVGLTDVSIDEEVLRNHAEKSWNVWHCGALVRESGIPNSWVKRFYFPRLLDYRDVTSARNPRMLEQTTDSALMVGGLMQSWHKDAPADLLHAFSKQYKRTNFSQNSDFNETALERFFNLNAMLDPATRLLNQMTIWQDIDALAKKQEIPLG